MLADAARCTLPPALYAVRYLSHMYWAYLGLAINDFQGRTGWACATPPEPGTSCEITGDQARSLPAAGFLPFLSSAWPSALVDLC